MSPKKKNKPTKTKKVKTDIPTSTTQKKRNTLLHKIWNNIRFLRIVTSIATALTLFSGYFFISDQIYERNCEKSLNYVERNYKISLLNNTEIREWRDNLNKLEHNIGYKDAYNYYNGYFFVKSNTKLSGNYTKANNFLKKVNIDSKYYPSSVELRAINYHNKCKLNNALSKVNLLIKSLESNEWFEPEYFIIYLNKLNIEQNYKRLEELYTSFLQLYPANEDPIILPRGKNITLSPDVFFKTPSIDYLFKWFIYLNNKNSKFKNKFDKYFRKLIQNEQNITALKPSFEKSGVGLPINNNKFIFPNQIEIKDTKWIEYVKSSINYLFESDSIPTNYYSP
ncbi:MAG: hypothetical protein K8R74_01205 [Bacteroidales bacterium]|nr:hypothetical protein [Bacteroidales bacterium]